MFWPTVSGNVFFTEKPEILTREEKRAWLDTLKDVSLGSDAFFPFGDNIERAHKSGVDYIAQAGGSVRDDHVIDTCDNMYRNGIHRCTVVSPLTENSCF